MEKVIIECGETRTAEFKKEFPQDSSKCIKTVVAFANGVCPNLRNNVAYGLLSSNELNSVYSVYCLWFCFKLVFINFYNSEIMENKEASELFQGES